MEIHNKEDWWNCVIANWDDLIAIANQFLPMHQPVINCEPLAEACGISFPDTRTAAQAFIEARDNRNAEGIIGFLSAAWEAAPDRPSIHRIRGWDVLCDLCSEAWVFDDRGEPATA